METTVAQVSRYLDRGDVALFSREIEGLVMLSFQRSLRRRVARLRRIETLGGSDELSNRAVDQKWTRQVHARLQLEQIVRSLCDRSQAILALRYAGYTWKEAAQLLGESVPALRSAFWRDVARVKRELNGPGHKQPQGQPQLQQDVATCGTN